MSHFFRRASNYGDFAEWVDFDYWWSFSSGGSLINGDSPSEYYTRYNNIIDSYNSATRLVIVQMEETQIQSKYRHKSVLHKLKYYVKTNQHVQDTNTNWKREKLCVINRRQSNTHGQSAKVIVIRMLKKNQADLES